MTFRAPPCINDFPKLATLLYADNSSIIVTSPNLENSETQIDRNIWGY